MSWKNDMDESNRIQNEKKEEQISSKDIHKREPKVTIEKVENERSIHKSGSTPSNLPDLKQGIETPTKNILNTTESRKRIKKDETSPKGAITTHSMSPGFTLPAAPFRSPLGKFQPSSSSNKLQLPTSKRESTSGISPRKIHFHKSAKQNIKQKTDVDRKCFVYNQRNESPSKTPSVKIDESQTNYGKMLSFLGSPQHELAIELLTQNRAILLLLFRHTFGWIRVDKKTLLEKSITLEKNMQYLLDFSNTHLVSIISVLLPDQTSDEFNYSNNNNNNNNNNQNKNDDLDHYNEGTKEKKIKEDRGNEVTEPPKSIMAEKEKSLIITDVKQRSEASEYKQIEMNKIKESKSAMEIEKVVKINNEKIINNNNDKVDENENKVASILFSMARGQQSRSSAINAANRLINSKPPTDKAEEVNPHGEVITNSKRKSSTSDDPRESENLLISLSKKKPKLSSNNDD